MTRKGKRRNTFSSSKSRYRSEHSTPPTLSPHPAPLGRSTANPDICPTCPARHPGRSRHRPVARRPGTGRSPPLRPRSRHLPDTLPASPRTIPTPPGRFRCPPGHGTDPTGRSRVLPGPRSGPARGSPASKFLNVETNN